MGAFVLGLLLGKKAEDIQIEIAKKQIEPGGQGELEISRAKGFFSAPGFFVRYRAGFSTKDGKTASCIFNPVRAKNNYENFDVPGRGAYFNIKNELLIFDAPGFFQLTINAEPNRPAHNRMAPPFTEPLFLMIPQAAAVPPHTEEGAGGDTRSQVQFSKTDNLVENRPYVPGDDPRRINWKLYGHGPQSDLYVREGENSPIPHSRVLILIDTQIDPVLYSTEEGRREVDMLCENALGIMRESGNTEVHTGYTGSRILPANASSLAWPAVLPLLSEEALPDSAECTKIIILAAPRMSAGNCALDRFIDTQSPGKSINLVLLFSRGPENSKECGEAARACMSFYRRKNNVRVTYSEVMTPEAAGTRADAVLN